MNNKKVLILAWDFPPYTAIGAARPFSWYTNFNKNKIYPYVITRHWDDDNNFKDAYIRSSTVKNVTLKTSKEGTLIRVPYYANVRDKLILRYGYQKYRLLRKILSFSSYTLSFPLSIFDNKRNLYNEANSFLKNTNVDLIIATGEPFILHKYAYKLSKKFKIPYVLDYRDGWTTRDDNLNLKGFFKFLNNFYFRYYERNYIKNSKLVITSNPFEQPKLKKIVPNHLFKNVLNGYVEEEVALGKDVSQLSDEFRIGYAGTIYPFNCVEEFLDGFKKFLLENPNSKIKLMLLGINSQPKQLSRILNYDKELHPYIESTDRMDKKDLIQWFCKCNSLLVFTSPKIKLLPSKIYEYLPLKRKLIISLNDFADIKTIMDITNAGYNCNNSEDISRSIKEMYFEFKKTGKVNSNVHDFVQFSRRNQAKILADIILKLD